ncbi:MAG: glycosyltransferase family 2 protein [Candidatus Kerfeldbacteria bacterium]|nr:glycosyltransferase family 2 protein [Candidatus Kerfeldbacteria bacterium]
MKVFIIIPAYQESSSVGAVVAGVRSYAESVVVVDDGSTDGTGEAARAAGALVLRHMVNRGYGAALTTGTAYALAQGAEAVVHFDADGQFEPRDIPPLVSALSVGRPSAALGSRFLGRAVNLPWLRRLTLKLAVIFTWAVSGVRLSDAHNGLRAFTREALALMHWRQDRMAFSSEVIDELVRAKIPWTEVPVTVRYTAYSQQGSKQGKLPALKIVKDLFFGRLVK